MAHFDLGEQHSDGLVAGDKRNGNRTRFAKVLPWRNQTFGGLGVGEPGPLNAPLRNHLRSISGRIEYGKGAEAIGKEASQTLGDDEESLFTRGAGLQQGAELVDLSDFSGLTMGGIKQARNFLMRNSQLLLCCPALRDFLVLMKLGKGQPQSKSQQRCCDGHIREQSP